MALISFRLTKVFLLFGCVVFLAGCGFKGPLYLPAGKTETRQPAPAATPEPAPERPVPAEAAPPPR